MVPRVGSGPSKSTSSPASAPIASMFAGLRANVGTRFQAAPRCGLQGAPRATRRSASRKRPAESILKPPSARRLMEVSRRSGAAQDAGRELLLDPLCEPLCRHLLYAASERRRCRTPGCQSTPNCPGLPQVAPPVLPGCSVRVRPGLVEYGHPAPSCSGEVMIRFGKVSPA